LYTRCVPTGSWPSSPFLVCIFIGGAYAVVPAKQYTASVVLVAQRRLVPLTRVPTSGHSDRDSQITVEAENSTIDAEAQANVPDATARCRWPSALSGPGVEHVTIKASSTDPAAAQAYANATAARVLKVTNRDAGSLLVLSELGAAELPTKPTNPASRWPWLHRVRPHCPPCSPLAAGALRRFVAADEISERLGIPVLGEVPVLVHPGANPADMFDGGSDQRGLEAFQQLRSHLHVMFRDSHPVIAFTSCTLAKASPPSSPTRRGRSPRRVSSCGGRRRSRQRDCTDLRCAHSTPV